MRILFYSLFLISFIGAFGQSDSTNLIDMSLQDLMNLKVITATKSDIELNQAPSVIRVFTKEDFQKYGFMNLQEVLMTVPGIQVQEYRSGHQLVTVRGVQSRYNNKVLMLIDGVPMRDIYYGNFNIDNMFPLESVERVEILNGPGSVLYGTNSFAGVINIVTRKEGRGAGFAVGTYGSYQVGGNYNYKGLYVNASYFYTDGFYPDLEVTGNPWKVNQKANRIFGLIKYKYKGFSVLGGMAHYIYPYKYREIVKEDQFTRSPYWGSLKYEKKLNHNFSTRVNVFGNYYQFERYKIKYKDKEKSEIKEEETEYLNTFLGGTDLELNYTKGKNELLVGFSWLHERAMDIHNNRTIGKPADLGESKNLLEDNAYRHTTGIFVQDLFKLNKNIFFTAGVRYDHLNAFDDQFNYRLGVTVRSNKSLYAKLLYGTAYRVPSFREYITVEAYNTSLQPEHLKTFEAQVGITRSFADINLTYFNNHYSNFIQEIIVDSADRAGVMTEIDDEMSFNFKSRDVSGVELQANMKILKNLSIRPSLTLFLSNTQSFGNLEKGIYTSDTISTRETENYFLSKFMATTSISYTWNDRITTGINFVYNGNRNIPSNYQANIDSLVQNKRNADGFVRLDYHLQAKIVKGLYAFGKVNNLLDARIFSPPVGGAADYDTQWPGRVIWLGLSYRFK